MNSYWFHFSRDENAKKEIDSEKKPICIFSYSFRMALRFHRLLGGSLLNFSTEYVSTVEFKMETSKQKCKIKL